MISWSPLLMPLWNLSSQTTSEFQPPETSRRQIHNRLLYNERYLATTRGVWKGGARETCPPPEIPMLIKIRGGLFYNALLQLLLAYCLQLLGLRPRPPPGFCPWTPLGDYVPVPRFCPPPKQISSYTPLLIDCRMQRLGNSYASDFSSCLVSM